MDGETEDRQDVDVVEEQTDDTLSSDEVDITQPWQPTPTLEAAAANRSGPGLRRDQSLELASDPPQGTEFSQKRSSNQRIKRSSSPRIERSSCQRQGTEFSQKRSSGAPFGGIVSPECTSGAPQETEFSPERSSPGRYAVLQSESQERAGDSSSNAESVSQNRPCRGVTEPRVTFGNGARTDTDCRTTTAVQANALPGHPSVREREWVNASLDTTVPMMEAPLGAAALGWLTFPGGKWGEQLDQWPPAGKTRHRTKGNRLG